MHTITKLIKGLKSIIKISLRNIITKEYRIP